MMGVRNRILNRVYETIGFVVALSCGTVAGVVGDIGSKVKE
jgi:hypothetical protein